jgi:hypothetical protein
MEYEYLLENFLRIWQYLRDIPKHYPPFNGTWIFVAELLENLVSQRYQEIIRLLMEHEYLLENVFRI